MGFCQHFIIVDDDFSLGRRGFSCFREKGVDLKFHSFKSEKKRINKRKLNLKNLKVLDTYDLIF